MSWHFLQEGGAASWDPACSGGVPPALSRLIHTHDPYSSPDSETGSLSPFRSGTTFAPSTVDRGEDESTSSAAAFPAKTLAARARARGLVGIARDFGAKCSASLARFGLRAFLPKTPRGSALAALASSSKGLPAWGIAYAGECWELISSVRRISGGACGSWPTPTTQGNEFAPSMQKHPGHQPLVASLRSQQMLATLRTRETYKSQAFNRPSDEAYRELLATTLPTPTAKLYGNNRGGAAGRTGKVRPSLETMIGGVSIALREWMMGWPIGWTALGPLETGRFRTWQRSLRSFWAHRSE